MIEDKELRDLFKVESEEHLQHLNEGLLRLEKEPKDGAVLEEVFREAHSLKGAARMVGVSDVEAIAHKMEDVLSAAKGGKTVLTSDIIDRLYHGLDSIQRLVNMAVTGEPAGVNVSEVIAQIGGGDKKSLESEAGTIHESPVKRSETIQDMPSTGSGPTEAVISEKVPANAAPVETEHQLSSAPAPEFRIETVRVDTKMLDMLMTQAGELAVTKTHIARHVAEIEEISDLWESLEKKVPAIHELPKIYSEFQTKIQYLISKMNEDSARLDFIAGRIEDGIGKIRLVPMSTIFNLYPRIVRDMAREKGKEAELIVEGGDVTADKRIIEEMKDPVMHMIRNAIDHGIEAPEERERLGKHRTGTVRLKAYQANGSIFIEVSDDGKGLDIEAIKRTITKRKIFREDELAAMTSSDIEALIFTSGFSTSPFVTEVSGRGVGLDVLRKSVERLKGTLSLETSPDAGCRFMVKLPITLATVRVLIVEADGRVYAIPIEYIETSCFVSNGDMFPVAGRKTISFDSQPVSVARLSELLEVQLSPPSLQKIDSEKAFPCLILSVGSEKIGVLVDSLIDEQEVVLKPQGFILKRVRNVSGTAVLATGELCMVLNPHDLLKSFGKTEAPPAPERPVEEAVQKKVVLLAEDSITTRTREKRILEDAGYEVVTAVDGLDAFNKLILRPFDAVVSDILMPNMDGLTFTKKIRQDKKYKELPVILVTSLASDEDRKKGMECGANAYIAKPTFDQKMLLDILGRLI